MITSLTAHWGHDKVLQGLHLRKDTSGKRQCICICCIQWRVDVGSFILTSSMQMQLHRLRQSCLSNKMVYIYKFINLQNSSNSWLQCGNQASPELKPVHAHPAQLCLTCRCCQSLEMCFCYLRLHKINAIRDLKKQVLIISTESCFRRQSFFWVAWDAWVSASLCESLSTRFVIYNSKRAPVRRFHLPHPQIQLGLETPTEAAGLQRL